jgi:hypothetical protein
VDKEGTKKKTMIFIMEKWESLCSRSRQKASDIDKQVCLKVVKPFESRDFPSNSVNIVTVIKRTSIAFDLHCLHVFGFNFCSECYFSSYQTLHCSTS